jgi:hypothetical protein
VLTDPTSNAPTPCRSPRKERRLWHDDTRNPPCLGCSGCRELSICGGLRLNLRSFDCLDFCCKNPSACDRVCRNNPDYVDRVREIGGFDLAQIPRTHPLIAPELPLVVPVLFHDSTRVSRIAAPVAALSLYQIFDRRTGEPRHVSHEAVCAAYGIAPGTKLVLTGTARDRPLERWWGLGTARRRAVIRTAKAVGVVLTTTPNFSLFLDRPRWDDLHAMMRIALVHCEFMEEGLPAALHVNGRTEADFARWAAYLAGRPEITHVAYEFATGTARRRERHAAWLAELARSAGRPLDLVVRGGTDVLPLLASTYVRVTVLDTNVFMKTMMRQRAMPVGIGVPPTWQPSPTPLGDPLDGLLADNLAAVETWLTDAAPGLRQMRAPARAA